MVKRKCSNCGIKFELYNRIYRSDLVFCSTKCRYEFMDKNSKLRKELGWNSLKEVI